MKREAVDVTPKPEPPSGPKTPPPKKVKDAVDITISDDDIEDITQVNLSAKSGRKRTFTPNTKWKDRAVGFGAGFTSAYLMGPAVALAGAGASTACSLMESASVTPAMSSNPVATSTPISSYVPSLSTSVGLIANTVAGAYNWMARKKNNGIEGAKVEHKKNSTEWRATIDTTDDPKALKEIAGHLLDHIDKSTQQSFQLAEEFGSDIAKAIESKKQGKERMEKERTEKERMEKEQMEKQRMEKEQTEKEHKEEVEKAKKCSQHERTVNNTVVKRTHNYLEEGETDVPSSMPLDLLNL